MDLKRFFYSLFLLSFLSCQSDQEANRRPSGILSPDSLVLILREVHEAEGLLANSGMRQDSAAVLFQVCEAKLYRKYGIDSTRFSESLKYYTSNLKVLDSIYHVLREEYK